MACPGCRVCSSTTASARRRPGPPTGSACSTWHPPTQPAISSCGGSTKRPRSPPPCPSRSPPTSTSTPPPRRCGHPDRAGRQGRRPSPRLLSEEHPGEVVQLRGDASLLGDDIADGGDLHGAAAHHRHHRPAPAGRQRVGGGSHPRRPDAVVGGGAAATLRVPEDGGTGLEPGPVLDRGREPLADTALAQLRVPRRRRSAPAHLPPGPCRPC